MSFFKFLFSKAFLKQIGLAIVALLVLTFVILQWLKVNTNHGETFSVPDLSKLSLAEVEQRLEDVNMRFEVMDSTNYNPSYPKYSVIEQTPAAGDQVKKNRKIYLTINPSGYKKVSVPNIIQNTRRSATATLKAVGFELGKVEYVNEIGKDMVYGIKYNGKRIQPGTMVKKTSKIDLILGNGNRPSSNANNEASNGGQ